jgi:predicted membrane-bound mannosyltransferase
MARKSSKAESRAQRRSNAANGYQSAPATTELTAAGSDMALSLANAEINAPEDDVAREEVVPVLSSVYDGTPVREWVTYRSRQVWDYIRSMRREQWLWIGVILLATILRFWDLGAKPLHHDESMHAFFSLTFARNPASYQYDPLLHGPFQFHAEGFVFMVLLAAQRIFGVGGAAGNPWINDTTARILPALFGIGIVALPLGLRRQLGSVGALVAALLLAVSPTFVYFSRFLREDIYFNFFMFAMVVCAVQYAQRRTIRWMVGLFLATVFAYATFEGVYLTMVVFVSFLVLLVLWESAYSLARRLPKELTRRERLFFSRAGLLLVAGGIGGILAYIGLRILNTLSTHIIKNTKQTDVQIVQLENATVLVLLYLSIAVAIVVIGVLLWQISRDDSQVSVDGEPYTDDDEEYPPHVSFASRLEAIFTAPGRRLAALRTRIDPDEKPFLHMLLGISWVHWFVGFVAGWVLFAALYWVLPPGPGGNLTWGQGFQIGIGKGVWQGLYYWLQQQQIARGGQPVYYYLLLLPLYEQLAIVFGLAGAVYSLFRPTRFRMFLVWWFVVSIGLYSWAGEKMPWLSLHILLPLMLLAAVMIERVIAACVELSWDVREQGLRGLLLRPAGQVQLASESVEPGVQEVGTTEPEKAVSPAISAIRHGYQVAAPVVRRGYQAIAWRSVGTIVTAALALALFIPMVHSMVELAYVHPADGPHEMMVYVQTTPDVTAAMAKVNAADQKLHGGKHQLQIWVGQGEEWPMYWYLRDYYFDPHPSTYVTVDPASLSDKFVEGVPAPDVLFLLPSDAATFMAAHPGYHAKQYKLRSWWDEAYKPLPCVPSKTVACSSDANWGSGVGLANYLSYGSHPPANAKFDLGRTVNRLWNWLWYREPLGDVNGSYDFTLVVRDGLPIQP